MARKSIQRKPARRKERGGSPPRTAAKRGAPTCIVSELTRALDRIAPPTLAAEWDNVGLLLGMPTWPAQRCLIALDLTDDVANEALTEGANVVVVYHPPIFKGIKRLAHSAEGPTRQMAELLAARISVIALHTALDAAPGGTNDVLLDAFEPVERWPLQPSERTATRFKLVVFVPSSEVAALRAALAAAGAGVIGRYSECSFELDGRGSFRGDEESNPTIGERLKLEIAPETRLEMVVPRARLAAVVRALYANHSYEEPAFDLYPLHAVDRRGEAGMGRVGRLSIPTHGTLLTQQLARVADMTMAAAVGSLDWDFSRVVVAAGSFGADAFRDIDALYITGEMKHHDALTLQRRGVSAILLGHAESERPALVRVRDRLRAEITGAEFELARSDRGPFWPLVPRTATRRPPERS